MELTNLSADEMHVVQALVLISLLTLPLKGLALWKAAQLKRQMWFIILLIVNTLGILDIIYYFFLDTQPPSPKSKKQS